MFLISMFGFEASQRLISASKPQSDAVAELGKKPCLVLMTFVNI
jgi:hypothetical protein